MKFTFALVASVFLTASSAYAAKTLNCHTDETQVSADLFRSFDMSLPLNDANLFEDSGKLYVNSYPPHPVEPNPFMKVSTETVEVKDSMMGAQGEIILYFIAGGVNYVLDVKKERADKFVGTLKGNGGKRFRLEARCYLFPSFP